MKKISNYEKSFYLIIGVKFAGHRKYAYHALILLYGIDR